MRVPMAMIVGGIVALLGAAIWTALAYYVRVEIGWVAWGIGAAVGVGVFAGSGRHGDFSLGILAVLLALASILLGKFSAAYMDVKVFATGDDLYITAIADDVMHQRELQGQRFPIVTQAQLDKANSWSDLYPDQIWSEAKARWNSMSEADRDELRRVPLLANKQYHIVYLADTLVEEYLASGKSVDWPIGMTQENAFYEEDYPAELWSDAQQRWDAMSMDEQSAYRAGMIEFEAARLEAGRQQWQEESVTAAFLASFSPFDGLWAILAVVSAFKIASASEPHATA